MKIVFICGSLEDGKDGVGDYTRRLGKKLSEEDCTVGIIALHDKYVTGEPLEAREELDVEMLRLPTQLSWKRRTALAGDFIKKINPDWISLQFVGFAYQRYGLPLGMSALVKRVSGNRNLHIMFHELWCGMSASAPSKEKILGRLQYWFLRGMLAVLRPKKIFTNIERYRKKLKEMNEDPVLVPVFSNIPSSSRATAASWNEIIAGKNLKLLLRGLERKLVLGFFGSIYLIPGFEALMRSAWEAARVLQLECCILLIGNNSKEDLDRLCGNRMKSQVFELGLQPAGIINRAMDLVDFGVITTPIDGMNKSGSAAAWMERGIPILVSGEDHTYEGQDLKAEYGIYRVKGKEDVVDAYQQRYEHRVKEERLSGVAASYMQHL